MSNSFKKMLSEKVIKRTDNGQFIRLEDIHVRPGFNARDIDEDYERDIQELVAFLDAGGKVNPLWVTARDEGGVWVDDGHRRTEAYRRLAAKGTPVEWIHIQQFVGNDAERVALIAYSNSQRPLKPMERASVYARLRAFNWSNDEIARRMGKDAEHVKRYLDLIDAPTAVQQMVKAGEVSATTAVRQVRKHGEGAAEVLKQELASAQEQGKRKVTGGTISKPKKAQQEHVATIVLPDSEADIHDEGPYMGRDDWERLKALPAGTKLYAVLPEAPAAGGDA